MKIFLNKNKISILTVIVVLSIWQLFLKPSLTDILIELKSEWRNIYPDMLYTLSLGVIGLLLSLILAVFLAVLIDLKKIIKDMIYPFIYISQLLPMIVLAPIFVLYFGYTAVPKILVVIMGCFFPITLNILSSLSQIDRKKINMVKIMGGSNYDVYRYVKFPKILNGMISGLKISGTFCLSGALIAEWLGGTKGLGIYMIIAKKSYNYLGLYSVTFLVVILSLALVTIICFLEKIIIKKERN